MNKLLSLVVDEFLSWWRELIYCLVFLSFSDLVVFFCAVLMILGFGLPWLSTSDNFLKNGLYFSFHGHLFLALWAVIEVRKTYLVQTDFIPKDLMLIIPLRLRRIALMYILIGVLSVIFSVGLLFYFTYLARLNGGLLDIRWGFYLTTFSGLTILFCGLERIYRQK